jgi:hypothetical protein
VAQKIIALRLFSNYFSPARAVAENKTGRQQSACLEFAKRKGKNALRPEKNPPTD